jgi:hypothetical protein
VEETPTNTSIKKKKFLEMAEKGMQKQKELAEKAKQRQMEKRGEMMASPLKDKSPVRTKAKDLKEKKEEDEVKDKPEEPHVPKLGGSQKLPVKKDPLAPTFKLPKPLEVIREIAKSPKKREFSPIKFIDGNVKVEPREKKPPSKYVLEMIRRSFVELVHKYDIYQTKKRVAAMTATKKNVQSRFLKVLEVYRKFKDRKHQDELEDKVDNLPPKKRVKLGYHDDPDIKENEFHIKVLNEDLGNFFKNAGEDDLYNKHMKLLKKQSLIEK